MTVRPQPNLNQTSTGPQPIEVQPWLVEQPFWKKEKVFWTLDQLSWGSTRTSTSWAGGQPKPRPTELGVDPNLDQLSLRSTSSSSGLIDWVVFGSTTNFFNLKPFKQVWKNIRHKVLVKNMKSSNLKNI